MVFRAAAYVTATVGVGSEFRTLERPEGGVGLGATGRAMSERKESVGPRRTREHESAEGASPLRCVVRAAVV